MPKNSLQSQKLHLLHFIVWFERNVDENLASLRALLQEWRLFSSATFPMPNLNQKVLLAKLIVSKAYFLTNDNMGAQGPILG